MTTLLAPWDPNYEAKVGPRLEWVSWGTYSFVSGGAGMTWE